MSSRLPEISVVAPAFNEDEVIEGVVRAWGDALRSAGRAFEIIIADDGSTDRTFEVLSRVRSDVPELRVVRFSRNRGYGPALAAAIAASRGEFVMTIDSDGQFSVADGLGLLDDVRRRGIDAVTGYRRAKKDTFIKVLADRVLNLLVNVICGVRFKDNNCALKVVRGALLRALPLNTRWLTPSEILVRLVWDGRSVAQSGVDHRPRGGGKSKIHVVVVQCLRIMAVMVYLRLELYLGRHGMLFRPEAVDGAATLPTGSAVDAPAAEPATGPVPSRPSAAAANRSERLDTRAH